MAHDAMAEYQRLAAQVDAMNATAPSIASPVPAPHVRELEERVAQLEGQLLLERTDARSLSHALNEAAAREEALLQQLAAAEARAAQSAAELASVVVARAAAPPRAAASAPTSDGAAAIPINYKCGAHGGTLSRQTTCILCCLAADGGGSLCVRAWKESGVYTERRNCAAPHGERCGTGLCDHGIRRNTACGECGRTKKARRSA